MTIERVGVCACLLLVLAFAGCGGNNPDKVFASVSDSNAKRLGTLYLQYQICNPDDILLGPSDKEQFIEFIKTQNSNGLERIGVDKNNLETLFVSERDKEPFKIRWEVQGVSRGAAQPVIFENTGSNGKFMVGFTGFVEKEVDQAEYERLWSGAADGDGSE